jgi:potassium efflux system protein
MSPASRVNRNAVLRLPLAALVLFTVAVGSHLAAAQDQAAGTTDATLPGDAAVTALRDALAADSSVSDEQRANLSDRLNGAARDIEIARDADVELAQLRERLERSETLIADYEARTQDISSAPTTVQQRLGRNPELPAIEAEIGVVESQRTDWARQRTEALDAMANLASNDAELRRRLSELSAPQEDGEETGENSSAIGDRITELAVKARALATARQRELIELKLRGVAELNKIRTAKINWLDAAIAEADALLVALREAAAESRASAGEQRSAEIRRLTAGLANPRPELEALVSGNLELVAEFQRLGRLIEEARRNVSSARSTIEGIQQDSQLTQRRLEVAGLEAELGDVMLSRLASLPDPAVIVSRNRDRAQNIARVSSSAIDTEQALRGMSDRMSYLTATVGVDEGWTPDERRIAERLLDQRRSLLQDNLQAQNTLLRILVDENQASEELASVTASYRDLLTGNLLWVRNYSYVKPERLLHQLTIIRDDLDPLTLAKRWPRLLRDPFFLLPAVLLLVVFMRRGAATRALEATLGAPIRPRDESVTLIAKGLVLTLVSAAPFALALFVAGRAFLSVADGDMLAMAVGRAFYSAAATLYFLDVIRRMAGRFGVGRRLLKWNTPKSDLLMSDLRWFRPAFALSAATIVLGIETLPTESGGAIAAIGSLSMSSILLVIMQHQLRSGLYNGDWVLRNALRAGVLLSIAIVLMHLSGQLFAAHLYQRALVLTLGAILGVMFTASVLQRCLIIHRLGLERKTREERRIREGENEGEEATEEAREESMSAVSSLSEAYTQLLNLLRLGALAALLWMIWSPALPALSIFDSVVLWTTTDASLPAGELREINLSVLLIAAVVVIVTLLITKHLPPLLNVLLMEWTRVTAGSRYAAGMLVQYLVIGIGFSSALMMLGFQWAKVQWLVAALGVGIGFGLQEIVANFISGLIVLFERPIRVGDIINAGGEDGTVVNINPRATIIETFEGKEVLIPNKELITKNVTNWSLTSTRLRIVVPVGIAYGSDVEDAIRRLISIAHANPRVLDDPAPFVSFEDFGDNALLLWLRGYAMENYLDVKTELRREIYRDFNNAGIGIAFPQRDVHLDASEPLPIRILREDENGS